MGLFDDLLDEGRPQRAGLFDDLIPQAGAGRSLGLGGPTAQELTRHKARERALDDMDKDETLQWALRLQHAEKLAREADETDRPWISLTSGNAGNDSATSFYQGILRVAQLPFALHGLATGNVDNAGSRFFGKLIDDAQSTKSDKAHKETAAQSAKVATADGMLDSFGLGLSTTVTNPTLLLDQVNQQIPNFVFGGGAGHAVKTALTPAIGRVVSWALPRSDKASLLAAQAAAAGSRHLQSAGAISTNALIQGQDIAQDTFKRAMSIPVEQWGDDQGFAELLAGGAAPEQARHQRAEQIAANAGRMATGISLGTMLLPAGAITEGSFKSLKNAPVGKAALGELSQETLEEGGGAYVSARSLQHLDPTINPLKEAGAAGGQGGAFGLMMGGGIAALGGNPAPAPRPSLLRRLGLTEPLAPETIQVASSKPDAAPPVQPVGGPAAESVENLSGDILALEGERGLARPAEEAPPDPLARVAQDFEVLRAQRTAQAAVLREQGDEAGALAQEARAAELPMLRAPADEQAMATFNRVADAFEAWSGTRPTAYESDDSSDGFAYGGGVYVNVLRPEQSIAFTMAHEFEHVVRKRAADGDTGAAKAVTLLDQVWSEISDAGKLKYAAEYLRKKEVEAGSITPEQALQTPELRSEMLADFMAKRMSSPTFLRNLAKKNPETFGEFISSWIDSLGQLLGKLAGSRDLGAKDIDPYIKRIRKANQVARDVALEWAQLNPSYQARIDEAIAQRPSVIFEIAPDPNNAELSERWRALPETQRRDVSLRGLRELVVPTLQELGAHGTLREQIGSYLDDTNTSFAAQLRTGDPLPVAMALGRGLSQDSMMVLSEQPFEGASEGGAVTVELPEGADVRATYDTLRALKAGDVHPVEGQSTIGRRMVVLNTSPLSTQELAAAVHEALGEEFTVDGHDRAYFAFPGKEDYDHDAQAGETGGSDQDPWRAIGRDLRGKASAWLEGQLGKPDAGPVEGLGDGIPFSKQQSVGVAGLAEPAVRPGDRDAARRGDRGNPEGAAGGAQAGAAAGPVQGVHYSHARGLNTLAGGRFGSGIRGAEAQRLAQAADPRIKRRVYFYIARQDGSMPRREEGLGPHAHVADLANLLDPRSSEHMQRMRAVRKGADANSFESAVLDAGFDGHFSPSAGVAVVLGRDVPVRYVGAQDQALTPAKAPKADEANSRAEGDELVSRHSPDEEMLRNMAAILAAAPSLRMEWGEARVNASEAEVANRALRQAGSSVQFSLRERTYLDEASDRDLMGAFDPFAGEIETIVADDEIDFDKDFDIEAEQEALRAELAAEMEALKRRSDGGIPGKVTREQAAEKGLFAEEAFPAPRIEATTINGRPGYAITMDGPSKVLQAGAYPEAASGQWTVVLPRSGGNGEILSGRRLTEDGALALAQRTMASRWLRRMEYDILDGVPAKAVKSVVRGWRALAELPGAFRFERQAGRSALAQGTAKTVMDIAEQLLRHSDVKVAEVTATNGFVHVELQDGSRGRQDASIEVVTARRGEPTKVIVHASSLVHGSSVGSALYQVAFAFADRIGAVVQADPEGLTMVNTSRRTEQMVSALSRVGGSAFVEPGVGQRVYGWKAGATKRADIDANYARALLASLRNVGELVPEFRDSSITYDPARGAFLRDGKSAEPLIKEILARPDVRAYSLGRATLARAALTQQMLAGANPAKGLESLAAPVLYSRRQETARPALQSPETDDSATIEASKLNGVKVSMDIRIEDTGEVATMTMDAGRALADLEDRAQRLRKLVGCLGR